MGINRFSVRVWKLTPIHTYLLLYVNGSLVVSSDYGVCLRNDEVEDFLRRIRPDFIDWRRDAPIPEYLESAPDAPFENMYKLKE